MWTGDGEKGSEVMACRCGSQRAADRGHSCLLHPSIRAQCAARQAWICSRSCNSATSTQPVRIALLCCLRLSQSTSIRRCRGELRAGVSTGLSGSAPRRANARLTRLTRHSQLSASSYCSHSALGNFYAQAIVTVDEAKHRCSLCQKVRRDRETTCSRGAATGPHRTHAIRLQYAHHSSPFSLSLALCVPARDRSCRCSRRWSS